jgi:uncharacterized membrane-anchored protein YjiN (DUF445 family)
MTLTSVKLTDKNIREDINNLQEKILDGKENLHNTDDYLDEAVTDNLEKFGNCETVKQVKETYQSLKTIEVEEYKTKVKGLKAELTEIQEKVANSEVSADANITDSVKEVESNFKYLRSELERESRRTCDVYKEERKRVIREIGGDLSDDDSSDDDA